MAFSGWESSWADDGVEEDVGAVTESDGAGGRLSVGVGAGAPRVLTGDLIAEDGEVLFDDSWADEGFVRVPSVAQEALELLQLLGTSPPASPAGIPAAPAAPSDARSGRPADRPDRNSPPPRSIRGGSGGVLRGGGSHVGSSISPPDSFF